MKRWLIYTPAALAWLARIVILALLKPVRERLESARTHWHFAKEAWRAREWFLVLDELLHAVEEFIPDFLICGRLRECFCTWVVLRYKY
jgi:hypothetical protein